MNPAVNLAVGVERAFVRYPRLAMFVALGSREPDHGGGWADLEIGLSHALVELDAFPLAARLAASVHVRGHHDWGLGPRGALRIGIDGSEAQLLVDVSYQTIWVWRDDTADAEHGFTFGLIAARPFRAWGGGYR